MVIKNYYRLLKVKPESDLNEIKKAFRIEVAKFHPDVNKSNNAVQHFEDLIEAFDVLSKTNKRAFYDSLLKEINATNSNTLNKAKEEVIKKWKKEAKIKSKKYRIETQESSFVTDFMLDILFQSIFDTTGEIIEGAFDFFGDLLEDLF